MNDGFYHRSGDGLSTPKSDLDSARNNVPVKIRGRISRLPSHLL